MSELKNEIVKILEGAKDPSLLTKIKSAIIKFGAETGIAPQAPLVEPVGEPIKLDANTAKLKDGTNVSYDGELAVGVVLNVVAEDGTMSIAPDGSHELEDGTIVTVANGVVSEIKKVEPAEPAVAETETMLPKMAQAFSALELKFSAQEKEKNEIKAELAETKETLKNILLAFETIINAPVVNSTVAKVKSYDEMTNHEKMLFNKGKL